MKAMCRLRNNKGFSQILVLLIVIVLAAFLVSNYITGDGAHSGVITNMKVQGADTEAHMDSLNTKMTTATTP